ncbi:MAG: putative metal-binding motif-containing protein [Desulfobulbaceae bacterium]|nr:putative metal-binding motif-containing protein [Desulfobulbaceae bacterium]
MRSKLANIVFSACIEPAECGRRLLLPVILAMAALFSMAFVFPAQAADCVDSDSDGYVACAGCEAPAGTSCGDCAEGNAAIYPGAAELCNGVDDDCDGSVDEGFDVGSECAYWQDPPGCSAGDPGGCCLSGIGELACTADGSGTECVIINFPPGADESWGTCYTDPSPTKCWVQLMQTGEPPGSDPSDASCFDGKDNDCDGYFDHEETACQTDELCDGFDNDGNGSIDETFTNLGDSCSVGVGECARTGVYVCTADGSATECNASAGTAVVEGPPGNTGKCNDGLDNDCDGYVDYPADPDCLTDEVCDGFDNDGDGSVDEDFTLGIPCTAGIGPCQVSGTTECSADGLSTVCSVIADASKAVTEGPSGPTCKDGVDNDCDGNIDAADADCSYADLYAWCSLEYLRAEPGDDCTGWHTVNFGVSGNSENAKLTAELLAIDLDDTIVATTLLDTGDEIHMASRIEPYDFLFKSDKKGKRHWDFSPVPMVRVMVEDGGNTAYAYCSNIPYLERIAPAEGKVLSASQGDSIEVVAAIPRVDPAQLAVLIDGVDVFAALAGVFDPAFDTYFAGGSPAGDVYDNGNLLFTVSELIIDTGAVYEQSSNTLSFTLTNLGCGGHMVVVEGVEKDGIFSAWTSPDCNQDDLNDNGTFSVFAIFIDTPTPGMVTGTVPTPVEGEVCHGLPVSSLYINGKNAGPDMTCVETPGDGETTADSWNCDFATTLPRTNLAAEVAGTNTTLGTFDPGSNKLHALAEDLQGNRTTAKVDFAIGNVNAVSTASMPVALSTSDKHMIEGVVAEVFKEEFDASLTSTGVDISDAMVLGLEPDAINTFFAETCKAANATAKEKIIASLKGKSLEPKGIDYECDPTIYTDIQDAHVTSDLQCTVTPVDNKLIVDVVVPTITADLYSHGHCCTGCDFICWVEVTVSQYATATLNNAQVSFDLTEGVFLGTESVTEAAFTGGTLDILLGASNNDVGCIVGFFQDLFDAILDVFFFIFTFGQVDNPVDFSFDFEGVFKQVDLVDKIGVITFPEKVAEIKINDQLVADTDKLLTAKLEKVEITPNGFMGSLKANFSPTFENPVIEGDQNALSSPADPPAPVVSNPPTGNAYFVISDDAINQLFASMTKQGEVQSMCLPSGKCAGGTNDEKTCVDDSVCTGGGTCNYLTVGDLLPADCLDIPAILPKVRGICEGMKRGDCEALTQINAQGACHGTVGDNCETIPVSSFPELEKQTCRDTPNRNIFYDDPLMFCARADVPPYVLIQDNVDIDGNPVSTEGIVETYLRLNDLLVGIIVDRDNDQAISGGELNALPGCFVDGADTTGDCKIIASCLDMNIQADLGLDTSGGGLRIKPTIGSIKLPPRDAGQPCEGGFNFGGDENVLNQSADSSSIGDLESNVEFFTPALQSDGLDLGGIVTFENPKLISIDTPGGIPGSESDFQDYLGITGDIVEPAE